MNVQFENLGTVNKVSINSVGTGTFWFSHGTCVAFTTPKVNFMVRVNDLGTTTMEKILNELEPNKALRMSVEVFEVRLNEALKNL